jgi:hypothetical protein
VTVRPVIQTFDHVLADPDAYRAVALARSFRSMTFGPTTFHGLAPAADQTLENILRARLPGAEPTLSFFRSSPQGQAEPHDVHSDQDMGHWTAILYLHPDPAPGDGTLFWEHRPTQTRHGPWTPALAAVSRDRSQWDVWSRVDAQFGRLLVFRSDLFHSRALPDNYGSGHAARLIQVCFGTWRTDALEVGG